MPQDNRHNVTLNYTEEAGIQRLVQPPTLFVRTGHKIHFERGTIPPGRTLAVIFDEPQFFSAATFNEGDGDIEVISDLPHRTTYQCGLRGDDGQIIQKSLSGPGAGGDIDPPVGGNGS